MAQKLTSFFAKYKQPLFFALLGVLAGIAPSVINHFGEFWKWSIAAKTASNYGFWIIFVALIIINSKSRKFAVLNVFLFCFIMCIVYGVVETLYKMPQYFAGHLSTSNVFGNNPLGFFFEYEFAQAFWFVIIVVLIPISLLLYNYTHKQTGLVAAAAANILVVLPLAWACISILLHLTNDVVVCADIANRWTPADCTFQSPDAWIIGNRILEASLYLGFIVFWIVRGVSLRTKKLVPTK